MPAKHELPGRICDFMCRVDVLMMLRIYMSSTGDWGKINDTLTGPLHSPSLPHVMSSTQVDDSALEKSTPILKEHRFKLSRYFFSAQFYSLLKLDVYRACDRCR